jgi:predicted nucleic acid-binding protein
LTVAIYFLDTSAVVKRYVLETGSAWVQALTATAGNVHYVARITRPETVAAITRRERGGQILPADAAAALADFDLDLARQYRVIGMSNALIDRAAGLARTYALRGYDAVQLAAALEVWSQIRTAVLISADAELNAAAVSEGMPVDDPNSHP